ncbi:two-component sensor histidine kinase [Corynebacterium sp. HMSC058E07]|uniref:sensor histidine kinase n=1 Tax=Corynebacterium sp. HMSC058E07 TaxID=1715157 RepID=UPI0008CF1577|nr:histidine kinase [Corynebacterium sp. HMSC058E07]OFM58312.1 two-component sensor histidine kinase [Corynebacterium sp. HMSC058E07]
MSYEAVPRPVWWRDASWWVFVSIAGFLYFFLGAGATFGSGIVSATWQVVLAVVGLITSFIGLLLQRFRPEPGVAVVALGMFFFAASAMLVWPLGYLVVAYEAYFISAKLTLRRKLWLTLLLLGSFFAMVWATCYNAGTTGVGVDFRTAEFWLFWGLIVLLTVLTVALMWLTGRYSLRRDQSVEALAARAELATVSERNRIARELHDIVAHSLTVVIAQADGGRYAGRKDPDKAIEALDTIAARGRSALTQMRELLSVLHEDAPSPRSTSVTPGVAGVPDLVEDAKRSGVQVQLKVIGEPRQLDEVRDLSVYRIVQESLTNVLKHAGSVPAQVRLEWEPARVFISVDNAPGDEQIEGSGRGLTGIRQRVAIHGGTARWGASAVYPGGWNVTATVPYAKED